uniref:ABC transporter domain-containing protein n=1 Tax=Chlamydomonas euryale TaxID=1486919 RepID=A0A7R9Z2A2_9CHLO|mmetsp:Transcript_40266/g.120092  ORF Transcript_40266/g.120092 Transcript_40266/m.120092 type:complete len:794 (+) Transcript_40266:299-2680(+)
MADVGDKNGVAETSMRPRGCGPVTGVVDWLMSFATVRGFFALYRKNALVAVRNHRATLLRLIAPLLFLLLALLIDKAIQANDAGQETFQDVMDPTAELIAPIPSCNEDMYIGPSNCSELMYSPNNYITQAIMGNVTSRNAVPITAAAYPSQDSVQDYLLAHPDEVIGAVHFVFEDPSNPSVLNGFIVQTNTTVKFFKGTYQDPNTFVQLPLQSAVQREITRYYMSETPSLAGMAEDLVWNVSIKTFAHPAIATTSVLGQVLGPFVFAACMFSFVSQIGFMVAEKEQGLRQALQSMGCTTAAYWLSWAAWEFTIAFFSANLIACFGLLLHFDLFLNNNYGLLFFLFFLFLLALSSLGMFVCTLISKQQVAVYVGFAIFLIGWIMQTVVIFGVPYSVDFYYDYNMALTCIFSLFPWDLLAKGFGDLGSATVTSTSPGISWSQRYSYCQDIPLSQDQPPFDPKEQYIDYECVMPLGTIYVVLTVLWLGYFVLAVYFDQIIPNAMGVKLPLWFPFMPSYWMPSLAKARGLHSIDDGMGPDDRPDEQDGDVAEEEVRMRELLQHRTGAASDAAEMSAAGANLKNRNAVEVFGLKRVFPYIPCSGSCGSFCFAFARTKDERAFWAIKNSWLGIPEGQLFCLLGPNGAGKSTTINVLTGVLPASDGEALVYGEPISAAGSMERIRSMMGVCPQFDVLWGELTGVEHLQIYGAVKGVDWRRVGGEADELLEKVKLTYAARQQTAAYSGGMRRRLSVAIALLGNPKVRGLGEPFPHLPAGKGCERGGQEVSPASVHLLGQRT